MKKKTMRMLSAALAVTLLSGCGAAQTSTPAETSVNQAMLLEKSAQPQEGAYTFPEKFTGDWTGQEGKLTIHADAQVVAELGTALPTATVEPREFTQEDVDNLLKVLLKGQSRSARIPLTMPTPTNGMATRMPPSRLPKSWKSVGRVSLPIIQKK